jgi:hypothetical protein
MSFLMTQQETANLAGPYFTKISTVIQRGFQDYLEMLDSQTAKGIRTSFHARTMASFIHDQIQVRARNEFSSEPSVKVDEFNGMFGLLISGKVFIRFKKLNAEMKASNVKTEQVDLFRKQQLEIPGFGRLMLLTAGYVPDPTWTIIQSIFLTCQQEDEVIWYKDLHGETTQVSIFNGGSMINGGSADEEELVKIKTQVTGNNQATGTGN